MHPQKAPGTYQTYLKQRLFLNLINEVYGQVTQKNQQRLIRDILGAQARYSSCRTHFRYRGEVYGYPHIKPPRYVPNLHPNLAPAMQEYLAEEQELAQEKPLVTGYLLRILNCSNSLHDYLRLLPESLQPTVRNLVLEPNDLQWWDVPPTLTDPEVTAFLTENEPYIIQLKCRMVLNLLL